MVIYSTLRRFFAFKADAAVHSHTISPAAKIHKLTIKTRVDLITLLSAIQNRVTPIEDLSDDPPDCVPAHIRKDFE